MLIELLRVFVKADVRFGATFMLPEQLFAGAKDRIIYLASIRGARITRHIRTPA